MISANGTSGLIFERVDSAITQEVQPVSMRFIDAGISTRDKIQKQSKASSTIQEGLEEQRSRIIDGFCEEFLQILESDSLEYGRTSLVEKYTLKWLKADCTVVQMALGRLYVGHVGNVKLLVSILQVIAHVGRVAVSPAGETLAMAALSHESLEVRESGIRVFEYWEDPSVVSVLKHLRVVPEWLDQYRLDVVAQLEA